MFSSVVLYSGGIDSIVTLKYVKKNIDPEAKPVYFDIKSAYSREEINMIKKTEPSCIIDSRVSLSDIEQPDSFIPNRNIILATLAVSRYSRKVFIGGSLSDRVSDNNKECFDELSKFLTRIDGKHVITITSPFWNFYKEDMVRWFVEKSGETEIDLLNKSFSCYAPRSETAGYEYFVKGTKLQGETKHCFKCKACFRRNSYLSNHHIYLPFYNKEVIDKYQHEFTTTLDYSPRVTTTLTYIDNLKRFFYVS